MSEITMTKAEVRLNDPNTTPEQYLNLVFPPSAAAAKAAFVH